MFYETTISVPAGTLEAAPVKEVLKLERGIIHYVEVEFRAGARWLVYVTIRRALFQLSPKNPDSQHRGDFWPIRYTTWIPLEAEPYAVEIYGWAPTTEYAHEVTVRINVDPREVLLPPNPEAGILARLSKLIFGRE